MINLKETFGKKVKVTVEESCESHDKVHYYIVQGKRGDVMAWDDALLEVTVYGKTLQLDPNVLPQKTHNMKLPNSMEQSGWKAKNHYDDSTVFLVPLSEATKAFKVIKARNKRKVTEEMRQKGRELALKMRSNKENLDKTGVKTTYLPKNVSGGTK